MSFIFQISTFFVLYLEITYIITVEDLANWKVRIEEPVKTTYKGVEVYKLTHWTQGPAMLQALNILENFDLKSMGYNSARYVNTIYQAMSLALPTAIFTMATRISRLPSQLKDFCPKLTPKNEAS